MLFSRSTAVVAVCTPQLSFFASASVLMLLPAFMRMPCCDSKYGTEKSTTLARWGRDRHLREREVVVGDGARDDGVEAHVADAEVGQPEHRLHALGDVVLVARRELGRVAVAAFPEPGPGQAGDDREGVRPSTGLKSAAAAGLGVLPHSGASAAAVVVGVVFELAGLLLLLARRHAGGDRDRHTDDCKLAHSGLPSSGSMRSGGRPQGHHGLGNDRSARASASERPRFGRR